MARITIEIEEYGSLTREYDDDALINGDLDIQRNVEDMVDTLINSTTHFF